MSRAEYPFLPIVVCIDVEPDLQAPDPGQPVAWRGFEACMRLFRRLRKTLGKDGGRPVRFSWFLRADEQIAHLHGDPSYLFRAHADDLAELKANGDAIGLHFHPWRWSEPSGWVQDFADGDHMEAWIRRSFAVFRESTGQQCRCFRFGHHWLDARTVRLLSELGATIDLSVEPGVCKPSPYGPGMDLAHRGVMPDWRGTPQRPFRASELPPDRSPGKDADLLWFLPVSTAPRSQPVRQDHRREAGVTWTIERAGGMVSGSLRILPNPAPLSGDATRTPARLQWDAHGTNRVELRRNGPKGPVLGSFAPAGEFAIPGGVRDRERFYLLDPASDADGAPDPVLAMATARTTWARGSTGPGQPPDSVLPLDLGHNTSFVVNAAVGLARDPRTTHLCLPLRSGIAASEIGRGNIEESLVATGRWSASRKPVFVTPEEALAELGLLAQRG